MFERLIPLIGKDNLERIKNTKILLVGVGGVGGYVLESLIRSGFENVSIVDGDFVAESNLNRQIIAKMDNLGVLKVDEASKRVISINPNVLINTIPIFLTTDNFNNYINDKYDYIIDACDDIKIKIELIKYAKNNNIKIISCLGTGRKIDASKIEITTLNKTFNDPLAKKLRHELKKNNIELNIPILFSKEEAKDTKGIVASAVFVPACAGVLLANYVFKDIIKESI